jgi:hypothetical protein
MMRVLLPRASILKVAQPCADGVGLSAGASLWAVGTSMMVLGEALIAVEGPTILPPGNEWLALIMRARQSRRGDATGADALLMAEGADAELALAMSRVTLTSGQIHLAEEIAARLDLQALRPQFAALELLRAAVEPWITTAGVGTSAVGVGGGADGAEPPVEEPCPICLSVVHAKSFQRPRLRCATCRHGMHATCIFRWLQQRAAQRGWAEQAADVKCPLCQSTL